MMNQQKPQIGRPKKDQFSFTGAIRKALNTKDPEKRVRKYQMIIDKAFQMALNGNVSMIQYLMNRIDGMPKGSAPEVNTNVVIPILGGTSSADYIQKINTGSDTDEEEYKKYMKKDCL